MNNDRKQLIPEFRFSEFVNDGEWKEKLLGEIGEFIGGGTPDTNNKDFWNGEIPWFTPTEIKNGVVGNSLRTITNIGLINSSAKLLPVGTILLTTRATIGDVAITQFESATNQGFQSLLVNEDESNFFWYYWLIQHKEELLKKSSGSTFPEIGKGEIKKIKCFSPCKEEQQKIASCLSSLDELITAQKEKLELLKNHKKGLMQNLFPQEGETVPKFRFPEFENDGDWEVSKMDNYINFYSGIPIKSEDLCDDNSGIPILRGINITEGSIRHSKEIDKYYLGTDDKILKCLVKENDIVIGMDGSKVGKNVALVRSTDQDSILIQRVARIRGNKNADINYIYQHFLSQNFRNYVDKVNTSSGIPHISAQQIKDFTVGFPSLPEQQKIASCLSSLDELILSQTEKIEQLQSHKKGLMQGLFPKIID